MIVPIVLERDSVRLLVIFRPFRVKKWLDRAYPVLMIPVTRVNDSSPASPAHAKVNARRMATGDRVPIHTVRLPAFLSVPICPRYVRGLSHARIRMGPIVYRSNNVTQLTKWDFPVRKLCVAMIRTNER